MRRAFTLLELLVASLLLGIIVTLLTMIFNQSSIAWRIGESTVADLGDVRVNMAAIREEDDNVFVHQDNLYRHVSAWDDNGNLRARTFLYGDADGKPTCCARPDIFKSPPDLGSLEPQPVGSIKYNSKFTTYIVNVISAGPDRDIETRYDNIESFPYDFEL